MKIVVSEVQYNVLINVSAIFYYLYKSQILYVSLHNKNKLSGKKTQQPIKCFLNVRGPQKMTW